MSKLNTILAGLIASIGFTTAAVAQEATPWNLSEFQSTKTRAEVAPRPPQRSVPGRSSMASVVLRHRQQRPVEEPRASDGRSARSAAARPAVRQRGRHVRHAGETEQIRLAGLRAIDPSLARAN